MATPRNIMKQRLRMNAAAATAGLPSINAATPAKQYSDSLPFTYEFASIVALGPLTGGLVMPVTTDQDADFYWHKGCIFVDSGSDGTTTETQLIPNLTVQITDGRTQRNLSQVPVHASNYFGNARYPYILPKPYFFASRTLITLLVANVSDNSTYSSIRISMHGIKWFF